MDYRDHLDKLNARFPNQNFLGVEDIAAYLYPPDKVKKPAKALRSRIDRGNFPPAQKLGSQLGCHVEILAAWLCGDEHPATKRGKKVATPQLLNHQGRHPSAASIIAAARLAGEFAFALASAVEAISLRTKVADKVPDTRPPGDTP